jgi:hypothetical protein
MKVKNIGDKLNLLNVKKKVVRVFYSDDDTVYPARTIDKDYNVRNETKGYESEEYR